MSTRSSPPPPQASNSDSDSKVQFSLDHAFGDFDFSPVGTFTARLKTGSHEEQAAGQSASQPQQPMATTQRGKTLLCEEDDQFLHMNLDGFWKLAMGLR
ncbi:hypothetical protein F0562_003424 [Nyssa sinensis]|uniref:Uncharacterized protein n=1 Tax=Nyssa sinensis TaxID=561372 RepID=A0A5J5BVD1_9ASTE|nr:hypothetical protein F0562_003424 [Nyssa sinensis]